jgi:hypothetical protein
MSDTSKRAISITAVFDQFDKTAVFKTAAENAQGQTRQQVTDTGVGSVAYCVALLADESPDLAVVAEAWADLPQALRTGIVAMVKSVAPN